MLHIVVASAWRGGVRSAREGSKSADDRDRPLQIGDRLQQRQTIGRWRLMDGQARERQTGNVHFLHRPPRILQAIERSLRDQLQAGGVQLFEQRTKRDAVARGQDFQIRERKR